MNRNSTLLLIILLGLSALIPRSYGQAFTGTIVGAVTDPNQAVVPNATVRLRNEATQEVRQATSTQDGRFTFSQLLPGTYELSAEASGFKRIVRTGIEVRVSQTLELDLPLQVGEVSQSVEVQAAVTLLDTQTANRSVTLSQQNVIDLPVNARNPFALVHVNAGVIAVRTGISQATQDQNHNRFSMNGGRGQAGLTLIDGVPAQAGDWGGLIASPSVDSVQEMNIARNQYDAQFGKSDGSVVNMITRGGSSDFHGNVFEFLRNDNLDANSWANNRAGLKRVEFQRNQFGGTLAGPIWRAKKLFFFGAYEGLRQGSPNTFIATVPTVLERQGDFSQSRVLVGGQAQVTPIFDPFSTRTENGVTIRDPFPGNVIPTSRFDPVAQRVLALFPLPNQPGDAVTQARNFASAGKTVTTNDRVDMRFDWAHNEKHSLYGRLTKAWQENVAPTFFGNGADTNFSDVNPRHQVIIGNTFVPNPTWVVNVLFGSGRWRENQISPSDGLSAATLGLPASLVAQFDWPTFPAFRFSNYDGIGNPRWLNVPRETHNLQVNNSKELGSHSLKFGFIGELIRLNNTDFNAPTFNFSRGMTAGPNAAVDSTVAGNNIASFLLGVGSGGSLPTRPALAMSNKYYGFYFQDGWRATRRLTLHLGLRYELQQARTERFNRVNNFDFDLRNPLSQATGLNLRGGLVFADEDNRGAWNTDRLDFAPRVGFAYKVTDKLVARGGYGIFYPPTASGGVGSDGFATTTTWVSSRGGDGINPANLLRNPFPTGLAVPVGATQGAATLVGESVTAWPFRHPTGYVQNFSLDFQYEITRDTILEFGYSGSQSRNILYGTGRNANQLDPSYLSLGAALNNPVDNPFFGQISQGVLSGRTVPLHRLLRPHPQFVNVNISESTPGASASFNALVVRFNKQMGSSLNLLTTYQWSKVIDNASEWQGWEVSDTLRNYYDPSSDRSISAHDLPHSFVNMLIYELPVGKGKKFGADLHPVANAIIGGWQVSSIVRLSSGLPLGFTAPNTLSPYGFNVQRPNITNLKDLAVDNPTPDRWFNTDAAVIRAPGAFEIGTAPRWLPNIRFGPTRHADIAILKNFRVGERWKAQFRGEMFNVTNTPQFGRAGTTLGAGDFGRVSGTTNVGPRNIQLGLRVSF